MPGINQKAWTCNCACRRKQNQNYRVEDQNQNSSFYHFQNWSWRRTQEYISVKHISIERTLTNASFTYQYFTTAFSIQPNKVNKPHTAHPLNTKLVTLLLSILAKVSLKSSWNISEHFWLSVLYNVLHNATTVIKFQIAKKYFTVYNMFHKQSLALTGTRLKIDS